MAIRTVSAAHDGGNDVLHGEAQMSDPLPRAKPEEVGLSSQRLADIAKTLNADIARGQIPGAVIAVARHGKLAYFEAFGFRDKAAGAPMTKDVIFNIASMTKPMTAVAALQLYEQGKLMMDEPLAKYFPKFADMPGRGDGRQEGDASSTACRRSARSRSRTCSATPTG